MLITSKIVSATKRDENQHAIPGTNNGKQERKGTKCNFHVRTNSDLGAQSSFARNWLEIQSSC